MHRLVVNPGTPNAWEVPLAPGVTTLGRGPENSCPIDHPSVSVAHCQLTVMNAGVLIKDLGSSGGTFVDDALVEEAVLVPGQSIRVGDVVMRFETEVAPSAPPIAATPSSAFCKFHPKSLARFLCPKCQVSFCDICISRRMSHGRGAVFCRTCAVECTPLQAHVAEVEEKPFLIQISDAFAYPFRGDGIILLVAGAVFFSFMGGVARYALFVGILLSVACAGYLISYMQHILVTSARGDNQMPDWPDFTSFEDVFWPFIQFLGTFALSFGPMIALRHYVSHDQPWYGWALVGAIFWGCLYFPMAFMAVAMFDTLAALNPLLVIPSILNVSLEYLVVFLLLVIVCSAAMFGNTLVLAVVPVPMLAGFASELISLYLMTIEMRLLGVLYWTRKSQLQWFKH